MYDILLYICSDLFLILRLLTDRVPFGVRQDYIIQYFICNL